MTLSIFTASHRDFLRSLPASAHVRVAFAFAFAFTFVFALPLGFDVFLATIAVVLVHVVAPIHASLRATMYSDSIVVTSLSLSLSLSIYIYTSLYLDVKTRNAPFYNVPCYYHRRQY